MIAKEFLSELRTTRRDFNWNFYRKDNQIRGVLKHSQNGQLFHPITAVCFIKTGKIYAADAWLDASVEIGLNWIDSGDIALAANNNVETASELAPYAQALRKEMIQALMVDSTKPAHAAWDFRIFRDFFGSTFKRKSAVSGR